MSLVTDEQAAAQINISGLESLSDCVGDDRKNSVGWISQLCSGPVLSRLRLLQ